MYSATSQDSLHSHIDNYDYPRECGHKPRCKNQSTTTKCIHQASIFRYKETGKCQFHFL